MKWRTPPAGFVPVLLAALVAAAHPARAQSKNDEHMDVPSAESAAFSLQEAEGVKEPPLPPPPERPARCIELAPGAALQAALDAAPSGASLCLAAGEYAAPIKVDGRTLWGPREAVIRSTGSGTTVRVLGGGALLGLTVDGSGNRFDQLDAAVQATGLAPRLEGLHVKNATFGLLVEKAKQATVVGNHVEGDRRAALGLRGDSIRLWETYGSRVERNVVLHGRDMVVWYSSDNVVRGNFLRDGRYGTHLMYSHRNQVEDNVYLRTVVGVFVMYSRDISVSRNVVAGAAGAAGMGLGLKESGNLQVIDNVFVRDTIGVYVDNSPLQQDDHNVFRGNHFRLGTTAIVFLSSTKRNSFVDNSFRDNTVAVKVEGGGDALGIGWERNDFDEYAGYDLDGDGFGDIPFELRSLATDLASKTPELQFFRGSPALAMLNAASELVPLLQPKTVLRDPSPRMQPLPLPPFVEALRAD